MLKVGDVVLLINGNKGKPIGYDDVGKVIIPKYQRFIKVGYAKVLSFEDKGNYYLANLKQKVEDYYHGISESEFKEVLKRFNYKNIYCGKFLSADGVYRDKIFSYNTKYNTIIQSTFERDGESSINVESYLWISGINSISRPLFRDRAVVFSDHFEKISLTAFNPAYSKPIKAITKMLDIVSKNLNNHNKKYGMNWFFDDIPNIVDYDSSVFSSVAACKTLNWCVYRIIDIKSDYDLSTKLFQKVYQVDTNYEEIHLPELSSVKKYIGKPAIDLYNCTSTDDLILEGVMEDRVRVRNLTTNKTFYRKVYEVVSKEEIGA